MYQDQVRRWLLTALGFLFVIYFFVERFPGAYNPISPGLDPSWRYGLNYLNHTDQIFGRDVVFTYGPLGYLLNAVNIRSNLLQALAFRLFLHAVLTTVLLYYLLRRQRVAPVMLFVFAYWIGANAGIGFTENEYEYSFVAATCLLTCLSYFEDSKAGLAADILNGFLAALFLFMKLTLGISAMSVIAVSLLVRVIRRNSAAWKHVYATVAPYAVTIVVVKLVYLKTPGNMFLWLKRSVDITEGFSSAMSIVGSTDLLNQAIIAMAVYLCLVLYLIIRKSPSLHIALALAVGLFFSFKLGFVRQDGHMMFFYPFLIFAVGIVLLNSQDSRELKICTIGLAIVTGLSIPVAKKFDLVSKARFDEIVSASPGIRNMKSLQNLSDTRIELDRESRNNLKDEQLPPDWLSLMKSNNSTVTSIPWEWGFCAINEINCVPFRTLQMYGAYKSSLDVWSAEQFAGANAPDFLLMDFSGVDRRNQLLDTPATWRSIFQNYEIARGKPQGLQLLKKKHSATVKMLNEIGKVKIDVDL